MDNHVHILFKSGKDGISTVMRKLLTWYAQYLNRRHQRKPMETESGLPIDIKSPRYRLNML
jgi:REP element-mobilizing transposase RayT